MRRDEPCGGHDRVSTGREVAVPRTAQVVSALDAKRAFDPGLGLLAHGRASYRRRPRIEALPASGPRRSFTVRRRRPPRLCARSTTSAVPSCDELVLTLAHRSPSLDDRAGHGPPDLPGDLPGMGPRRDDEVVRSHRLDPLADLLLSPDDTGRPGRRTDAEPRRTFEHVPILAHARRCGPLNAPRAAAGAVALRAASPRRARRSGSPGR